MELIPNMKLPDCSICSMPFSVNGYLSTKSIRIPLLLNCAHPACESCIISNLRMKNFITCLVCKKVSSAMSSSEDSDILSQFPIDNNLCGMCFNKSNSISLQSDTQIGFIKPVTKKRDTSKTTLCNECQDERADQLCKQCNAPYCSSCFKKVHSAARALRDHAALPLSGNNDTNNTNELEVTTCKEHVAHNLEFYCDQCDVTICSRCLLASHNGHKVEVLLEKNKNCRNEVISEYVRVSNIQRRLKTSKKETKQLLKTSKQRDSSPLEVEINDHFLRLHGSITLLQNKIANQIRATQSTESLNDVSLTLNSYVEEIENALHLTKSVLNDDKMSNVNYKNIVTLLKTKENIPCFVVRDFVDDNITFSADQNIFKTIEEHCVLNVKAKSAYKLVSSNDLPANYVPERIEEITCADVEDALAIIQENEEFVDKLVVSKKDSNGSSSLNKCLSDSSSVASVSSSVTDIPNSLHFDELVPGCTVQVTISHLISPSDFYIHRLGITKKTSDLQSHLRRCSLDRQKCRVSQQNIVKGAVFMIFVEQDNYWYRVRVMELNNDKEITVHFIDFGNTEVVAKDRLKAVSLIIKNTPPLALRCKLANCYPINGNSWDPQAVAIMTQITNSCADPVMISVLERTFHFYEVDMIRHSSSYSCNVADTLKFLSLAVASNVAHDFPTSTFKNHNMKTMPSKPTVKQGTILEAKMGHVIDPDHFYIIIKHGYNFLRKLSDLKDDMQRTYSGRNQHTLPMFNPKPGLYIAARFSGDKKWYRAEVIAIPDVKMVKVFYIDFGISEVLSWKNIKVLLSKFYKLPPQAQRCRLADVEPLGSEQWNERAAEILHSETINIPLKAMVDSIRDDAISVVLYKATPEADICINALLVRYQLAISIGISSTVVEFPKLYEMPKNENTFQCDISVEKQIKTAVNRKPAMLQTDMNSKYFIKTPNGCLKIQVDIKRIVDPGLFFVTLCYVYNDIQIMEDNLQKFYENPNLPLETEEWKVDSRCAVKIDNKWYRAIIEEILPDDQINVYIPDEGITEIVDVSILRKLDNQFLAQRDGVSKCHLGGLLPSLDNWSKTSITEFEEFVKNSVGNLYITKMTQSEMKGNSLPVELFKRSVIPAGPLEAARDTWTSFNHYLRMMGLAKADSVTKWDVDGNIITEGAQEDKDSVVSEAKLLQEILSASFKSTDRLEISESTQIDIHDVAVKWLPPEPVIALEFIGTPTYIDDDCNIYIQDFMRSTLTLPQICEDLTSKFDNTLPTPYDLQWTPGDICAAQYFVDNKWYRGLVKKVLNDKQVLVQFVDYGNIDPCPVGTLRKKPSMTSVPIQATCFQLHTIAPVHSDGQWKREDLDNIHSTVSTKNCRVELETVADGYGVKRLILATGKDAVALWIANRWARYANEPLVEYLQKMNLKEKEETEQVEEDDNEDGSEEEGEEEEEEVSEDIEDNSNNSEEIGSNIEEVAESKLYDDDDDDDDADDDEYSDKLCKRILHWSWLVSNHEELKPLCKYEQLEISEDIETLSVEMTAVLSETEIVINITENDNADLKKSKSEFNEIFEIMQKDAASQPLIKKPYRYKMCCAQFSADNTWYRAFVLDELQNETLLIQYIDYGNVEVLPAKQVHIIVNEWVKPKAQSILCCLHDIEVDSSILPKKEVMNKLSNCLSEGNLIAKIKTRSLVNVVELFYDDVLAYQALIDEGIFIKTTP